MGKSPLTKREWIAFIVVLMTVEFLVEMIAWTFAGHANALGYVSFAGTIISIILAILAIIYSYVQTISQQDSASTINSQVSQLVTAVAKIEVSKTDLREMLERLDIVSNKLDAQANSTAAIGEHLTVIRGNLANAVVAREETNRSNQKSQDSDGSLALKVRNENVEIPFLKGFVGTTEAIYTIYYANALDVTLHEMANGICGKVQDDLRRSNKTSDQLINELRDFDEGILLATQQFLRSQELMTRRDTPKSGDAWSKFHVDLYEPFKKKCKESIEKSLSDEKMDLYKFTKAVNDEYVRLKGEVAQ